MKILVESKVLPMAIPMTKAEEIQLFSFQNGVHPAFDAFDRSNPDAFVCHASVLDKAIIKNLKERPHVRIIIVDDSKENIDVLANEIGQIFDILPDLPYCELDQCLNATEDSSLKTSVFCPEGATFEDLSKWKFEKAKIFSAVGSINHLSFCGVLPPAKRFDGYKSCEYALVKENEWGNAIVCGAIPIHDSSLSPSTELTKDEVLGGLTNYEFSSNVLRILGKQKEADQLIAIKNWIGANN